LVSEGIGKYEVWNQGVGHRVSVLERSCLIKGAASLSDSRAVGRNTANSHRGQDFAGYCERHAQPLWGLVGLLAADRTSLAENPGIGAAKAARFVAMKELPKRHMLEGISRRIS
jgi:DNA repair protein RadC